MVGNSESTFRLILSVTVSQNQATIFDKTERESIILAVG